jgi:hypothetical protein
MRNRFVLVLALAAGLWIVVRANRPTPKSVVKAREKRRAERRAAAAKLAKKAAKQVRKRTS